MQEILITHDYVVCTQLQSHMTMKPFLTPTPPTSPEGKGNRLEKNTNQYIDPCSVD